jgi:hypothetical protein
MSINQQQLEAYRQALEAWKAASRDAQRLKDTIGRQPSSIDNMYILTDQDIQVLGKETDLLQRLITVARQL